jgi:hypothetical protein
MVDLIYVHGVGAIVAALEQVQGECYRELFVQVVLPITSERGNTSTTLSPTDRSSPHQSFAIW